MTVLQRNRRGFIASASFILAAGALGAGRPLADEPPPDIRSGTRPDLGGGLEPDGVAARSLPPRARELLQQLGVAPTPVSVRPS